MKSILNFKTITVIVCSIVFTQLTSCEVIRVTGADAGSGKLVLVDKDGNPAEEFTVRAGQTVKWKIKTDVVKSFKEMPLKKDRAENPNVFKTEPHKKLLSKTFKGKIEKTEVVKTEYYNIIWNDQKDSSHTYDPIMHVNPK